MGVVAVAVMVQHMCDEPVEPLPAGSGLDGDDGDAGGAGSGHQRIGRLLDEDRRRHLLVLTAEPSTRGGIGDTDQEERIRVTRADRHPEPDVVGVDQCHRPDRKVEPSRRVDEGHHGPVQRQQQLTESNSGRLHVV